MKCINRCADPADMNISWPTSRGSQSANVCGVCAADWWNKYKNTNSGQGVTISEPKSLKELQVICAEYVNYKEEV